MGGGLGGGLGLKWVLQLGHAHQQLLHVLLDVLQRRGTARILAGLLPPTSGPGCPKLEQRVDHLCRGSSPILCRDPSF